MKRIKRKATDREKLFVKHTSDEGLVSRIYTEELSKLSNYNSKQ